MPLTFSLISLPFKSLMIIFTSFCSCCSCVGESEGSTDGSMAFEEFSVLSSSSASVAFCVVSEEKE